MSSVCLLWHHYDMHPHKNREICGFLYKSIEKIWFWSAKRLDSFSFTTLLRLIVKSFFFLSLFAAQISGVNLLAKFVKNKMKGRIILGGPIFYLTSCRQIETLTPSSRKVLATSLNSSLIFLSEYEHVNRSFVEQRLFFQLQFHKDSHVAVGI